MYIIPVLVLMRYARTDLFTIPICTNFTHLCLLVISYVILPWFMNVVYDLISAWLRFSLFLFVVFLCIYILIPLDVYPNVNQIPPSHGLDGLNLPEESS